VRKLTGLLVFLLMTIHLSGQAMAIDSQLMARYPFVNWDRNELHFPGDSSRFVHLFGRMDSMLNGRRDHLHFFHIGGSHIQADIYSHRIRTCLQNLGPGCNGSRGFVFPYSMARTNNPGNFSVRYTGKWEGLRCSIYSDSIAWGLSGISAFTRDSTNEFTLASPPHAHHPFSFSGIRVFHNAWEQGYQVRPCDPDRITGEESCPELGYYEIYFDSARLYMTF